MSKSNLPWREIQRTNFTALKPLAEFLHLDRDPFLSLLNRPSFPLNVPLRLAEKIKKGTLDDPILKQFIPLAKEGVSLEAFTRDPVGDVKAQQEAKLLKKYAGRALLLTTSACAMHCRYCFRQHFAYQSNRKGYAAELDALQRDPSIKEVILSGGDPLSLDNRPLASLISSLESIPHLKRLRFHTRFPVGIPERIDTGFLNILSKTRLKVWFVLHCNHPRELDEEIFRALEQMGKLGIPLLNQSVLLRGVNDSVDVLQELSETLVDHGILPYYLHQLDRVEGAAHFEVSQEEGKKLVEALSHRLSGYGVPKYVREIAGLPAKHLI